MTPRELAIARQILVKAVADGTPIDVILAGARQTVAACDAPRYLPALPTWLAAHGWDKPPPQKPKRPRFAGNRRREPRMTPARAMAELAAELRGVS